VGTHYDYLLMLQCGLEIDLLNSGWCILNQKERHRPIVDWLMAVCWVIFLLTTLKRLRRLSEEAKGLSEVIRDATRADTTNSRSGSASFLRAGGFALTWLSLLIGMAAVIVAYQDLKAARQSLHIAEASLQPTIFPTAFRQPSSGGGTQMVLNVESTTSPPRYWDAQLIGYLIVNPGGNYGSIPVWSDSYWTEATPQKNELKRWVADEKWLDRAEKALSPEWRASLRGNYDYHEGSPQFVTEGALLSIGYVDQLGNQRTEYYITGSSS
jgi:hypothetical protein